METIKNMYEISVIIPTYKPQDYLFECLTSIKNQSFPKDMFEIIVVLNGEKTPYYDAIKKYTALELAGYHVELLYADMPGVSNARNIGIENSRGKYIAFIDDDDIISENYLQGMYDIAVRGMLPLSYILAFYNSIEDAGNYYITKIYEKNQERKLTLINCRSYFSTSYCKLIDRNTIGNKRYDTRFQNGEDALFMFLISNGIRKMQFTDKTAIYFRRMRKNSLATRQKDGNYIIGNCVRLFCAYSISYLRNMPGYNFLFLLTRIMATVKYSLQGLYNLLIL
ncbi:hypothetical protein FACS189442_2350 [Spirochaetia bacterium]|nr:hypothetical protein FACS189442_2350 [Spirochaetia bacterium]